jgi:hypothetical protein
MNAKTIFIIAITALFTVVLMNNTDMVDFWFFGDARVPKLAVLGIVFFAGGIAGFLAGRPRKKLPTHDAVDFEESSGDARPDSRNTLSEEDREYIS